MTLNGVMAVILRYSIEFDSFGSQLRKLLFCLLCFFSTIAWWIKIINTALYLENSVR